MTVTAPARDGWALRPAEQGIQIVFRRAGHIAVLGLYPDAAEAKRRLRKKIALYRPDGRRLPQKLFRPDRTPQDPVAYGLDRQDSRASLVRPENRATGSAGERAVTGFSA